MKTEALEPGFDAIRFERAHTMRFEASVDRVFHLFTPEGERAWVAGWDPQYLPSQRRALEPGAVFTTSVGEELTLWLVARFDAAAHEVAYARVVPGSRMGLVSVSCTATADGATDVTVTYDLTALSEDGNVLLRRIAAGGHSDMMRRWEMDVARALTAA
jgi:hypothetical protein